MKPETVVALAIGRLLKQGDYGTNGYMCIYLDPETGRKCAVGVLLTEEEAHVRFGNTTLAIANPSITMAIEVLPERLRPHEDLLRLMQQVHDMGARSGCGFLPMLLQMSTLPTS